MKEKKKDKLFNFISWFHTILVSARKMENLKKRKETEWCRWILFVQSFLRFFILMRNLCKGKRKSSSYISNDTTLWRLSICCHSKQLWIMMYALGHLLVQSLVCLHSLFVRSHRWITPNHSASPWFVCSLTHSLLSWPSQTNVSVKELKEAVRVQIQGRSHTNNFFWFL